MQSAETVLSVLRERGGRGLPCDELYRQMFNPQLYLLAYGRIYSNQGAMTPGVTEETVDGMSRGKIDRIIDAMRHERYRFSPARRTYIPKKNGKMRPLGMPTWSDKLVGEVVRLLLQAYYEPTFSDRSHGFRPGRGCHTALREVAIAWTGTTWFVEGDVTDCFGSLDHEVMITTLAEKIHDNRFLGLIHQMLTAGYLEDVFVETVLIPEYNRGERRARNPAYQKVVKALAQARKRGDRTLARELRKRLHSLPSGDPNDPGYRRLRYARYADDTLLGFTGPKAEAEEIKQRLAVFLRDDLKLELNADKTLITHAKTGAAKFLGYEITVQHADDKVTVGRRAANGTIDLRVPKDVVTATCARYLKGGKPTCRTPLVNEHDYVIVNTFGAEYRGIVQYYLLASNVHRLNRLQWVTQTSLLKTLARKYDSTVTKMAARHRAKTETPHGPRTCYEVVVGRGKDRKPLIARFGGIPLRRQRNAILQDRVPSRTRHPRKELISRLVRGRCELCKRSGDVQVHHIRNLAELDKSGTSRPTWMELMVKMRRKTLVVCDACHDHIHTTHAA
ncbi:MAG: hypothetical protein LC644_12340 [Pseudonocardia sp.]|nr:hypothetical protein [Pseudonocardia sp.]